MAELYVSRLYDMLGRHCPQPFVLYCFTDRPRRLPHEVVQRECAGWTELLRPGMRPTTQKLGLFNAAYIEFERFLYLDLSLIIRRDMGGLLAHAFGRHEDLVIVSHWKNEGYNSSVMCIRRGGLQRIYDAFVAGERFEQRVAGDQDFIHGVVTRHGLQAQVAHFATEHVVSFKSMVQLGRRDASLARGRIGDATIVKFHGSPKMHEAFAWRYRMHRRLEEILHGNFARVLPLRELQREWSAAPAASGG